MAEDEFERSEVEALLETRRELGPSYDRELVQSFAERIERAVEQRADSEVANRHHGVRQQEAAGKRQLALGIVSVVMGIPITAITLAVGDADLAGMVVAWAGIVGVNVAHSRQARPR